MAEQQELEIVYDPHERRERLEESWYYGEDEYGNKVKVEEKIVHHHRRASNGAWLCKECQNICILDR